MMFLANRREERKEGREGKKEREGGKAHKH